MLLTLQRKGFASKGREPGLWAITPLGRHHLAELDLVSELPKLTAEMHAEGSTVFSGVSHPLVPAEMAPPELARALRGFLSQYPLDTNIFGMTRFPTSDGNEIDPVEPALDAAREVASMHGLTFHLASDRAIVDDLWMKAFGSLIGMPLTISSARRWESARYLSSP